MGKFYCFRGYGITDEYDNMIGFAKTRVEAENNCRQNNIPIDRVIQLFDLKDKFKKTETEVKE